MESEIEGLHRLDSGEHKADFFTMAYGVAGNTPLENYEIVRRVAAEKGDSDVVTAQQSLESLLNIRAKVMNAKADVQAAVIAQLGADNDLGACE